jgi:nucleoside 2-deoxyribosyltransferase
MKSVYLAGPIAGLSYGGATDWREYAQAYLERHGILGRSPMRGKDMLKDRQSLGAIGMDDHPLTTNKGITARDRFDCTTSDVVLFNFLGAERASVGSCIEIGWADAARRPIIMAMEPGGVIRRDGDLPIARRAGANPHWHGIALECAGYVVPTLEDALRVAVAILA